MQDHKKAVNKPYLLILLFVICGLPLVSCGFHPVYGVNKYTAIGVEQYLEQVQIGNIPDREGQFLRNALIDRFYRNGRPANPKYNLSISDLSISSSDLDITIDSDTTRGRLTVTTSITLNDTDTKEELLSRNLRSTASYNILDSEYANRISEQNTLENIINDIARQIEEQLALRFKQVSFQQ